MSCFDRISSASIVLTVLTPLYECFLKKNFQNSCEGCLLLYTHQCLFLAGIRHIKRVKTTPLRGQFLQLPKLSWGYSLGKYLKDSATMTTRSYNWVGDGLSANFTPVLITPHNNNALRLVTVHSDLIVFYISHLITFVVSTFISTLQSVVSLPSHFQLYSNVP